MSTIPSYIPYRPVMKATTSLEGFKNSFKNIGIAFKNLNIKLKQGSKATGTRPQDLQASPPPKSLVSEKSKTNISNLQKKAEAKKTLTEKDLAELEDLRDKDADGELSIEDQKKLDDLEELLKGQK